MNSDQISAFVSAAGISPAAVGLTMALITAAAGLLWAANTVRKLGEQMLDDLDARAKKRFVFYTMRALMLVMVLVYFLT